MRVEMAAAEALFPGGASSNLLVDLHLASASTFFHSAGQELTTSSYIIPSLIMTIPILTVGTVSITEY